MIGALAKEWDAAMVVEPGIAVPLDQAERGYRVVKGKLEIYAALRRDNGHAGRRFILEIGEGGLVPPIGSVLDGLLLIALAVDEVTLEPCSLSALLELGREGTGSPLAQDLDLWIARLCEGVGRLVGPPPTDTLALSANEAASVGPSSAITSGDGVVWLEGQGVALDYCGIDGDTLGERMRIAAVAPGTWALFDAPGEVASLPTADIIARPGWPGLLAQTHDRLLALIEKALRERHAASGRALRGRTFSTRRSLARVFDRFDAVLGHARSQETTEQAVRDEPLVAPFAVVMAALGIEFSNRQRDQVARCETVDEAARALRLRNRVVMLSGNWRQEDLGPLIGFLDDERTPVALIRGGGGWRVAWREGNRPSVLDDALAARLAPTAEMLYPTLPDHPVGFRDFLAFTALANRGEILLAAGMALAGAMLGLATPLAMRLAFDQFIPARAVASLVELAVGLILAAGIAAAMRIVFDLASLRIEGRSSVALGAALMDRVLRLPNYALRLGPGDVASRLSGADNLRRSVWNVALVSISAVFFFLSNLALMFYYSPAAAGLALAFFLLLTGIALFCGYHQVDELRHGEQLLSDIYSIVFQFVQGITALRSTGSQDRAFARWGADFSELRRRVYRARRFSTLMETGFAAFELLALAAILWVIALMPRGALTTGAYISFITAYGVYMGSSLQLARGAVAVWNAKPSWGRVAPLLRATPDNSELKRHPGPLTGAIELTGVYFRYAPEAPLALQGLSMTIAPGEFVALVGPSGAGKSTITRLLLGFETPVSGAVQYDHQDLRHLDLELVRRQIGVVLQHSALFPGTLFENIVGISGATMDDAWEAARQAGIDADIRAMPMGMHTIVTEASIAFSGGQVQRLAIARALVNKPRILLLDEATSAVDGATQAIVTESLSRLAVTRVIIAHRLVTVKNADRIIVLDQGRIVQTGRFEELAARPGIFANLIGRQLF